jgi:Domain of unknown function (DUF1707)
MTGDEAFSPAELRASHEDRDRVADLLRIAAGDGRLTADELDERLEKALTARTLGELAQLSRDLPAGPSPDLAALTETPRDVLRIEREGGNARRDGRWVVPPRIEVRVGGGHVTLDFTQAVIVHPRLQIDAGVRSGTLTLVTRPGIEVDADDVVVSGSGTVKVRPPRSSDVPADLRITVTGTVSSGHFRARPRRRLRR